MEDYRNIPGHRLSDRLPVHSPDDSLWSGISGSLDNLEATQNYESRLQDLPIHNPETNTWSKILYRMRFARVVRIGSYSVMSLAAAILLLFSIFRLPGFFNSNNKDFGSRQTSELRHYPNTGKQLQNNVSALQMNPGQPAGKKVLNKGSFSAVKPSVNRIDNKSQVAGIEEQDNSLAEVAIVNIRLLDIKLLIPRQILEIPWKNLVLMPEYQAPLFANIDNTVKGKEPKYYTPDPYQPNKSRSSNFQVAANYLPVTLDNGSGSSMFHNVGLMASLGNDKTRIQSTIGMAYNSEHRTYDVGYTQSIPITVPKPGNPSSDSTIIMYAPGTSKLEGTEKHQYFTYDLGVGKKLFSLGKMTTWINTGAGFALKLDNASLKDETINAIKNHNNSVVNNIDLTIPDYNKVNINIMAGIDFNYAIFNKLTISFAPTSRFYLKPVLEQNGSSTDSFSLGFRSGLMFKF
ncbi:MAG: hypothetical protein HXX13_14475 [Bacteroidetes bacterium]|nr:hypothetical protein [Bacteroidota bacterium]